MKMTYRLMGLSIALLLVKNSVYAMEKVATEKSALRQQTIQQVCDSETKETRMREALLDEKWGINGFSAKLNKLKILSEDVMPDYIRAGFCGVLPAVILSYLSYFKLDPGITSIALSELAGFMMLGYLMYLRSSADNFNDVKKVSAYGFTVANAASLGTHMLQKTSIAQIPAHQLGIRLVSMVSIAFIVAKFYPQLLDALRINLLNNPTWQQGVVNQAAAHVVPTLKQDVTTQMRKSLSEISGRVTELKPSAKTE